MSLMCPLPRAWLPLGRVSLLCLLLPLSFACNERPSLWRPRRPRSSSAAHSENAAASASTHQEAMAAASVLQAEQRVIEIDPAGPPGDLAQEIAQFTNLAECVKQHRVHDALLMDSLEALGYENFVWDACRSLEAMKTHREARCGPILSSVVRTRCEASVAMLLGEPQRCPVIEHAGGIWQHESLCLAVARRDARPCVAMKAMERATCEGMVVRDERRCGTDERCVRGVRRWRSVLPPVSGTIPYKARITADIETDDAPAEHLEFAEEASAGAVVMRDKRGVQVVIGEPFLPSSARQDEATAGLLLHLPISASASSDVSDAKARVVLRYANSLELESRKEHPVKIHIDELSDHPDAPIRLTIDAELRSLGRTSSTHWVIDTWLRDVVAREEPNAGAAAAP